MLTSGQVWNGDADGSTSWATQNTWSGPDVLPPTLAQLADSAQNVPCKQDNCVFAGRAGHTAALRRESPMDSKTALAWRAWLHKDKRKAWPG